MTQDDREYYLLRANVERDRGDRAPDPVIATVHHKLADLYEERLGFGVVERPTLRVVA